MNLKFKPLKVNPFNKNTLTDEEKKEIVFKILKSRTFQKASTSSALLQYLLKAEINGAYLKESIIDLEFFGKKEDTNNSGSRVRVSIYNLRKKLDDYYQTEGKDSNWRIAIKKGQYSINFQKARKGYKFIKYLNIQTITLSVFLILTIFAYLQEIWPERPPEVWASFWSNNKPTTLFVSDIFGIKGKTITGNNGWTRDYSVNNIEDYIKLIEQKPELKNLTAPSDYNYTTIMGVHATYFLAKLFQRYGQDFSIQSASNASFSEIKESNMLYVGLIKNQSQFINLFNDSNPYFKIFENYIILLEFPQKLIRE